MNLKGKENFEACEETVCLTKKIKKIAISNWQEIDLNNDMLCKLITEKGTLSDL